MHTMRKVRVGRVVSDVMEKTLVVAVERRRPHPKYRRVVRTVHKFKVHDGESRASQGDLVRIGETRPISREKRWRLLEVLEHVEVAEVQPGQIAPPEEAHAGGAERYIEAAADATEEQESRE